MEEETQTSIEKDWRDNVSDVKATLKIQDGESVEVLFMNEGKPNHHSDFGESIVFEVNTKEFNEDKVEVVVTKSFYVNPQNFALLKQLKELGSLTGQAVKISRTGSKKSDTRYSVEKI